MYIVASAAKNLVVLGGGAGRKLRAVRAQCRGSHGLGDRIGEESLGNDAHAPTLWAALP